MRSRREPLLLIVLTSLLACGGDTPTTPTAPPPEPPPAPAVQNVNVVTQDGGRVDWSWQLNRIAFDREGADGFFDVYTMSPDGGNVQCVTCERRGSLRASSVSSGQLPGRHMGNPAWHPSGNYIVFQAEKPFHRGGSEKATPGVGVANDLWIITPDGQAHHQLTDLNEQLGVLHPHFSHDGTKLLWAEMVEPAPPGEIEGKWTLKMARFIAGGNPRLEDIQQYQPGGAVFYESHDFSRDDRSILFSGNLEPGQPMTGLDIYTMDLQTDRVINLTSTSNQWDEHAHYSPSGEFIIWMSSMGCNCNPDRLGDLRTDYWIMKADGSDKKRITFFNDPGHPDFIPERIIAGDGSWSPDGDRYAAYLIGHPGGGRRFRIVLLTFNREL